MTNILSNYIESIPYGWIGLPVLLLFFLVSYWSISRKHKRERKNIFKDDV